MGFVMITSRQNRHNLAAIQRALESGAKAVKVGDHYLVPSRTTGGRMYSVRVLITTHGVVVTCDCQAGHTQPPVGSTPCWHGALALVEEQADDHVVLDGETVTWRPGRCAPAPTRGYVSSRPTCPACETDLDEDVLIPVDRQVVTRDGVKIHRGCSA